MTAWLPKAENFREELRSALGSPDVEDTLAQLTRLSQHDLEYPQVLQLDKALCRLDTSRVSGLRRSRVAVLASATADHLLPAIRIAHLRRGDLAELYLCPYAQYRQELLDNQSGLHDFRPDYVLFSLAAREVLAGIPVNATRSHADNMIANYVDQLLPLWTLVQRSMSATVIQQLFLNSCDALFGNFDRLAPGAPARVIRAANELLVDAAMDNDVHLLDLERQVELDGLDFWYDTGRWLQAKIELSPVAAPRYGEMFARIVSALQGQSRKCLVLDLDNTLWGGVVGDDGVDNLVLGEGSAAGEAFLAFQRYVKGLRERGIILAVCSKNDLQTAESAFHQHPEMVLARDDFAAFVANWEDKSANIRQIADQLNIGVDAMVFVDDNPAERARIRQSLPMVAVPEIPDDPALFVRTLSGAGYFEAVSFTAEDAERARQYAENASRTALQADSETLDDYLISLDMSVTASPFRDPDLQRITQLVNKTNQFNTTTKRTTLEEIRRISADPSLLTRQFRLLDRFGDNGLVSAIILVPTSTDPDVMDIDTWIMSCRVFGRGLELEIMNQVVAAARARNIEIITGSYIPTTRNAIIKDLYPKLGFRSLGRPADNEDGTTRWQLHVTDYQTHDTHIGTKAP